MKYVILGDKRGGLSFFNIQKSTTFERTPFMKMGIEIVHPILISSRIRESLRQKNESRPWSPPEQEFTLISLSLGLCQRNVKKTWFQIKRAHLDLLENEGEFATNSKSEITSNALRSPLLLLPPTIWPAQASQVNLFDRHRCQINLLVFYSLNPFNSGFGFQPGERRWAFGLEDVARMRVLASA